MATNITHDFWETITPIRIINKQTGQFVIPAIGQINTNTLGVPIIAAQFTFFCTNNLTLQLTSIPPSPVGFGQYFNIAIRYTNPNGTVTRYKLWQLSLDPHIDVQAPLYTGQPIYKTFTVEVWSYANYPTLTLSQPIVLNTSNLMTKTFLNQDDTYLVAGSTLCTTLANVPTPMPGAPDPTFMEYWWDPGQGLTFHAGFQIATWTDRFAGNVLTNANPPNYCTAVRGVITVVPSGVLNQTVGFTASQVLDWYAVVEFSTWEAIRLIVDWGGTPGTRILNGNANSQVFADTDDTAPVYQPINGLYAIPNFVLLELDCQSGQVFAYDCNTGLCLGSFVLPQTLPNNISLIQVGDPNSVTAEFVCGDIIGYGASQSAAGRTATTRYLINKYCANAANLINLPLQFTQCAIGQS